MMMRILVLLAVFSATQVLAAFTPVFNYPTFCDTGGLHRAGAALKDNKFAYLTPSKSDRTGALWQEAKVALEKNWQTTFTFKIEGVQHGGADGFAFVIQGAPYDTTISGDRDDGLGYANLKNVVAFEFDMYQNSAIGDPNDHHVSLHYPSSKGGRVSASELANMDPGNVPRYHTLTANLKDGNVYTATITYTATSKQLQLTVAGSATGSTPESFTWTLPTTISSVIQLDSSNSGYVGFTASTGGHWEAHAILSWQWSYSDGSGCLPGFQTSGTNVCQQAPTGGNCAAHHSSCEQCSNAVSCCGWDKDKGQCLPSSSGGNLLYTCPKNENHKAVWWGIGIVIVVLVLCVIALFIYWRRTRIRKRTMDPTLLPSDQGQAAAETQYSEL